MSNELALQQENALATLLGGQNTVSKYHDEGKKVIGAAGSKYLPYIGLQQKKKKVNGETVADEGDFVLSFGKDDLTPLGTEFVCLALSYRPKAMCFNGDKPTAIYDPSNDEFTEFVAAADDKIQGYGYGDEVLMWLPEVGKFATYFFSNATGRRESPNITDVIDSGKPLVCKLQSKYIESGKNAWYGPKVMGHEFEIQLPSPEQTQTVVARFVDPPVEETADEEETTRD